MVKVSEKEAKAIERAVDEWKERGIITSGQGDEMLDIVEVSGFDWQIVMRYSLWLAIASFIISVSALFADKWIVETLKRIFDAPEIAKSVISAALAVFMYYLGIRRNNSSPEKIYTNEAIFFLGVVATAASLAYFGKAMEMKTDGYLRLLFVASILYGFLGLWFPSKSTWVFAIVSLGSWMGAKTGYVSGWGAYYLGMSYPLRFMFFGLFVLFAGIFVFSKWSARRDFLQPTKITALLYLFVSLWFLSIFGDYGGNGSIWHRADRVELFFWSVVFASAAIACIWYGIRYSDATTRGFGLTFLLINLYTKYFEYFWDHLHKSIFFGILAVSFWYLGSRAEKIWNIEKKARTESSKEVD